MYLKDTPNWPLSRASRSGPRRTITPSSGLPQVTPLAPSVLIAALRSPAGSPAAARALLSPFWVRNTARLLSQPSLITSGCEKKVPQLSATVWSHSI
ncbi:hypothetical protein D3C84_661400 [compost metagenome]